MHARSGELIRTILGNVHEQAWKDHLYSLAAVLPGPWRVSARQGWAGEKAGLFEQLVTIPWQETTRLRFTFLRVISNEGDGFGAHGGCGDFAAAAS